MTGGQNKDRSLMISTQSQATSGKLEANYLPNLDVYWLKKHQYLNEDKKGGFEWFDSFTGTTQLFLVSTHVTDYHPHLFLIYKLKNGQDKVLKLTLSRTKCGFDGWRFWFLCPLLKKNGLICGKRVGVLYKVNDIFGCRQCLELTYSSRKRNNRHSLYAWFRATALERRYERYIKEIKQVKYNHKFTKKYQRMEKIATKLNDLIKKLPE